MADSIVLPKPKQIKSYHPVDGVFYEIRVADRLGVQCVGWFEGMTLIFDDTVAPPQTVIRAYIKDQAALYGLIGRVRDLGLCLISVNMIDSLTDNL